VIARTTAAGALDPVFGVGGVRTFDLGAGSNMTSEDGDPLVLPDGRVVLPFNVSYFERAARVDPPASNGVYFGLFRLTGPPAAKTEQKPAATTTATPSTASSVVAVAPLHSPVARRCASRRSFRIRLRTGRSKKEQSKIVSTAITVNGRRVTAKRNGASVNLRNLPKGRFTVVINLRLADGGRVRDVRRYRTCAPKVERELAPLRTRKPK
jgi:hypothetical protein